MNVDSEERLLLVPRLLNLVFHPRPSRSFLTDEHDDCGFPFHLIIDPLLDGCVATSPHVLPFLRIENRLSFSSAHVLNKLNAIHISLVVKRVENCHVIPLGLDVIGCRRDDVRSRVPACLHPHASCIPKAPRECSDAVRRIVGCRRGHTGFLETRALVSWRHACSPLEKPTYTLSIPRCLSPLGSGNARTPTTCCDYTRGTAA